MIGRQPERFQIQDSQYEFPYHYIPHFDKNGTPSLMRKLNWGFDYLCYQRHIHEKVVGLNPASVLEVGCGDGYFVGNLPTSIPVRVGCDLSERAIAFAKAFHQDCQFFATDVGLLSEKFDIVAAIEVLEHIPEGLIADFFCKLSERLQENGRVVLSVPTTVIPLNKKHYRHYTIDLLKVQLSESGAMLEILDHEYIYTKPFWFDLFKRTFDNMLFSFEFKPFMRFAWNSIWKNNRYGNAKNGYHLVAVIGKIKK